MGRTAPTYRLLIEQLVEEWGPFRRALRAADRATFDALVNHARERASAGSNLAALDPVVPVLLSMLLAHESELVRLRAVLEALGGAGTHDPPGATVAAGGSGDPPAPAD